MSEEEVVADKKISDYNSADLLNMALHNEWDKARTAMQSGNYHRWKAILDSIWGELGGDTEKNDSDEKEWIKLNSEYSKLGIFHTDEVKGFTNKISSQRLTAISLHYNKLLEIHIWLKRLQNRKGKGTKYRDDADDYFD